MKMNLKNFMILLFVYFSFILIGTVCYILSFWINIFSSFDVLFFRGLVLLIIVCLIIALLLLIAKKKSNILKDIITYRDILLICTLLFFLNNWLYGMIPFNVSRSNSIILVSFLYENKGSPKTEEEITRFVINKYFYDYKAVSKRLQEQISSGNIQKVDNGYMLTKRGEIIVEAFGFIADLYNVKNNFITDGHRLPHNDSSFYK
jgi:predicted transcriptional regulator